MTDRNNRKVYTGRVVSDKMDKTISVLVETYKFHSLYGQRVRYSKKFKTHGNPAIISYKAFPFSRGSGGSSNYIRNFR